MSASGRLDRKLQTKCFHGRHSRISNEDRINVLYDVRTHLSSAEKRSCYARRTRRTGPNPSKEGTRETALCSRNSWRQAGCHRISLHLPFTVRKPSRLRFHVRGSGCAPCAWSPAKDSDHASASVASGLSSWIASLGSGYAPCAWSPAKDNDHASASVASGLSSWIASRGAGCAPCAWSPAKDSDHASASVASGLSSWIASRGAGYAPCAWSPAKDSDRASASAAPGLSSWIAECRDSGQTEEWDLAARLSPSSRANESGQRGERGPRRNCTSTGISS